ncbi:MAG: hypothetical protein ACOYX5_19710 [Actinomycetota bacterium]
MSTVRIVEVDERDSAWEDSDPRFRVYLHGSGADSTRGSTATYDVTGADVLQVIDWAQRQAGDRLTYAVALVRDRGGDSVALAHGRGLVWLVGMDGNDSATSEQERDVQSRMLARRADPVGITSADRMPDDTPRPRPLVRRAARARRSPY